MRQLDKTDEVAARVIFVSKASEFGYRTHIELDASSSVRVIEYSFIGERLA